MEVHVRNVPQRTTSNGLSKFLKAPLSKLSIFDVHVAKSSGAVSANLTFLSIDDANKFLAHHGQVRVAGKPTRNKGAVNLRFLNQPIYCEKSNREANPYTIRVLKKEKQDRENKANEVPRLRNYAPAKNGRTLPISFKCLSFSCGIWDYASPDSKLIFVPLQNWGIGGVARFGQRAMVLRLSSGQRIDFRYSSTVDITNVASQLPCLIFSMADPPLFFEDIVNPVEELLAELNINSQLSPMESRTRKAGPERHRVPHLNPQHKLIAGNCLVYRVILGPCSSSISDYQNIGKNIHLLREAHGIPVLIDHHIDVVESKEPYEISFQKLCNTLSSVVDPIPFELQFQIQRLAQNNYLAPSRVLELIPEIKRILSRSGSSICANAVRTICNRINFPGPNVEGTEFLLQTLIELLRESEEQLSRHGTSVNDVISEEISDNVANIHRAKVTPSNVLLTGPEIETKNRILRKYPRNHDCFLRVTFCDEDGQPVRFSSKISNELIFHGRFKEVLENGIRIGDRQFVFLGFSHSSLRSQTCWFMAPFVCDGELLWDQMVIRDLGDFSGITSPAKCAARIGQVFSDTPTAVKIDPTTVSMVPDVERNGHTFSDGMGTISSSVMEKIWDKLAKNSGVKPTLFQIRWSGAKGMLSLDSTLQGDVVRIRNSMEKFKGTNNTDLEICEAAWKPLPLYLNRQFIKILEDMGVQESFFLNLQKKEVERLRMITASPFNASSFLKRQSIGVAVDLPWFINKLHALNINFQDDEFLRNVLEVASLIELRLLKHKTRIPVQKGKHLHGIMDEYGVLEERQIFCCFTEEGKTIFLTGENIIISRAPALHPGDVQLVDAVAVPAGSPLRALRNCIVFSQKGARDLPSQLSGGDLDGDRYYVIWDGDARPKVTYTPADYARQPPVDIRRPVESTDMTDFFIKFMETDQLGRIAVMHRILADQRSSGTSDPDCITLAAMHSTAVDFSKTGIPVDMSKLPQYTPCRPDFEAPGPWVEIESKEGLQFQDAPDQDADYQDDDDDFVKYRYYESEKVLGTLYRSIDERRIISEIQERAAAHTRENRSARDIILSVWGYAQRTCPFVEWMHHKDWARDIRGTYEDCVRNIMREYNEHPSQSLTELEVFVGNILGRTGAQSKRQRELSTTLKERFEWDTTYIVERITKDDGKYSGEALQRAMACLAVSLEIDGERADRYRLLSFRYVAASLCLKEVDRFLETAAAY